MVGILTDAPNLWTRNGVITGQSDADIHLGNSTAGNALIDATAAFDNARTLVIAGLSSNATKVITGELQGKTFTRGMYTVGAVPPTKDSGAITMTGSFTLDGQGDANSVFIFHTEAAASTAAGMVMLLTGNARADHIFWLVGAAFSTGASASFSGTVLAGTSASVGASTSINGRIFALGAALTTGDAFSVVSLAPIPEPSVYGAAMGMIGLGVVMMRRRKACGTL